MIDPRFLQAVLSADASTSEVLHVSAIVTLNKIPPNISFSFFPYSGDFFTINGSTNSTTVISLNDCENAITAIKAACSPTPVCHNDN